MGDRHDTPLMRLMLVGTALVFLGGIGLAGLFFWWLVS